MAILLSIVLFWGIIPVKQAQATAFTDINGHWAYNEIVRVTDLGIFQGDSPTKFLPDGAMTRAMFVTILARYSNYNIASYNYTIFGDVPKGKWYTAAVTWAYNNGIATGTSQTEFSPNDIITREQSATFLVRYANYCGMILPRVREGKLFSDSAKCSNFALDPVYTLYRSGIVNGETSTTFAPQHSTTRAEAAKLLCEFMDVQGQPVYAAQQVKLINHRGYNTIAPENTLAAFQLAADYGYQYIETDVQFSKDGVPVLLHDATIDRTSNGSGSVANLTYTQLLQYDFGSWKSSAYAGTKIALFEDYIALCAQNNISPVIELKSTMTAAQVQKLVNLVEQFGLQDKAIWISFYLQNLQYVRNYRSSASMAFLVSTADDAAMRNAISLKTGYNQVSLSVDYSKLTVTQRAAALRNNLQLMIWTVNYVDTVTYYANSSVECITTDNITAGDLYY